MLDHSYKIALFEMKKAHQLSEFDLALAWAKGIEKGIRKYSESIFAHFKFAEMFAAGNLFVVKEDHVDISNDIAKFVLENQLYSQIEFVAFMCQPTCLHFCDRQKGPRESALVYTGSDETVQRQSPICTLN
jgi:hypothetical protein